jgi:DNA mismatch endonuclease (patch repair protein)
LKVVVRRARSGDVFSKEKRSWVMSRIRGTTEVERGFRRNCWRAGLRGWRVQRRVEGVRGDMVFLSRRTIVFIDGCFWHGCPRCYQAPRQNAAFWQWKLDSNRDRDARQTQLLRGRGWTVLRLWECDVVRRTGRSVARLSRLLYRRVPATAHQAGAGR